MPSIYHVSHSLLPALFCVVALVSSGTAYRRHIPHEWASYLISVHLFLSRSYIVYCVECTLLQKHQQKSNIHERFDSQNLETKRNREKKKARGENILTRLRRDLLVAFSYFVSYPSDPFLTCSSFLPIAHTRYNTQLASFPDLFFVSGPIPQCLGIFQLYHSCN